MAVLVTLGACDTAASLVRYECRLPDGSLRQLEQNAALRFPSLLLACHRVEVSASNELEMVVTEPVIAGRVRVIQSRSPEPLPQARVARPALPHPWTEIVEESARRHGVDASLVHAVIRVESAFQQRARSPKGAVGLMQLMPATAARFGASPTDDLYDPVLNIDIGVRYLRKLGELFGPRLELVLAGYNAGEGAVIRHGYKVPPYRETQDYVQKILALMASH